MVDQDKRQRPYHYIMRAIAMLNEVIDNKDFDIDILEIGCMRMGLGHDVDDTSHQCCNDGHSSYLFARTGWNFVSVDINPDHVKNAESACAGNDNAVFVCEDAISYAKRLFVEPKRIGLLFLDAWDLDAVDSAEQHLKFYDLIAPNLNRDCLILIDDTDLWYDNEKKEYFNDPTCETGKGKLLIPRLIEDGYKVVFKGRQTMLCAKEQ